MTTGAAYLKKLQAAVAGMDTPTESAPVPTKAPRKAAAKPKAKAVAKKSREGVASARKLQALERAGEAVRLKREGYNFPEIAQQLGISRQAAHQIVTKYRQEARELVIEDSLDLVLFELERLDYLLRKLKTGIDVGDPKSINTARQIVMDRAKLQGLVTDRQEVDANVVTGVFALPLTPTTPGDWSAGALAQTEGEEELAERIMSGTDDAAA